MHIHSNILGIDIGSVSVSVAEITPGGEVVGTAYQFHHGNIAETLRDILNRFHLPEISGIASTTSTPSVLTVNRQYDNRVSIIAAARHFYDEVGSVLFVGGEKFGLLRFDEQGNYLSFKANTSCAAGTGSFLDQQAKRLNLSGSAELSEIAFSNESEIPKIASRCAVFAKTDLVHAQQEGYSLDAICDGLCHGLARNIADTLFIGEKPNPPIIFTGGVSKNRAVVRHIQFILGRKVIANGTSVYGAIGAGLNLADELYLHKPLQITSADDVLIHTVRGKKYFYAPLELELSDYPDFRSVETYQYDEKPTVSEKPLFLPDDLAGSSERPGFSEKTRSLSEHPVEVDIYEPLNPSQKYEVYMGIDIGSTSTKAILADRDHAVAAGFYTRTAGRPVDAVQKIFAAIDDLIERKQLEVKFLGSGTTGSGRKFVGKLIAADIVIDEITAHARAACELNPEVDTIIEIGGQDSKFTTLRNGRVTFSVMNTVCAAGTGSFIEEQARKLGCPLSDYSARTANQRSPMSSDRCTVFMERDINHYLNEGYAVNEVLGSVLHSIRENYLTKVAIESSIGNTVFFQGATAKNKALVAAFERRLEKPIHVSEYCHLTGALGVALTLSDQNVSETTFRGIGLYKKHIPIQSQVCELCTNHCKITTADVDEEKVAYGFLCGRDYDTKKYVNNNLSGFDLLKERKKVFSFRPAKEYEQEFTIGIPAALHLYEDLPLWKMFFDSLSIKTVTSERYNDAIKEGKHLAGAEFCTPMTAIHGHVNYLLDRSDYIFLPFYLDSRVKEKEKGVRRQYCYYTQFSSPLLSAVGQEDGTSRENRFLMPLVNYLYYSFHAKVQLYKMLKSVSKRYISFFDVSAAYDAAFEFKDSCLSELREIYKRESRKTDDFHVVFLGRPYIILPKSMNKGIPNIFASLGIRTFFQDMLSCDGKDLKSVEPLLNELPWYYASEIMKAAEVVAQSRDAYPVFITAFKCSPDSFVIEYFKKLMESHEKPYLILQLDEHDSSVGYETRIEAAIRSFRNHHSQTPEVSEASEVSSGKESVNHAPSQDAGYGTRIEAAIRSLRDHYSQTSDVSEKAFVNDVPSLVPVKESVLGDRTLLIPNWDNISLKLVIANLRKEGIDARVMEASEASIRKSLRHNSGQCIPLNVIAQEFIDYVETHQLDPAKTVLWTAKSWLACNFRLFPHHIRTILNAYGKGMEKAGVYAGLASFGDFSLKISLNSYFAYMFGGLIRKAGCKIRPYEKNRGETDQVIEKSIDILCDAFSGNRSKTDALAKAVSLFEGIEVMSETVQRPKAAIFGDLYVRDNDVMNQNLIRFIEDNGGEVITTPFSDYAKMIAGPYMRKWFVEGYYLSALSSKALMATVNRVEKMYYRYFEHVLNEPAPVYDEPAEKILSEYNIRIENTGESMDNVLKIHYIKKHHPDVSLFVQTSPAFCCPSLVTEAMARDIERVAGVPIVSVTYDGTGGMKNDVIIPYLKYPREVCVDEGYGEMVRFGA